MHDVNVEFSRVLIRGELAPLPDTAPVPTETESYMPLQDTSRDSYTAGASDGNNDLLGEKDEKLEEDNR